MTSALPTPNVNIPGQIGDRVTQALDAIGFDSSGFDPAIRSSDPRFGDFQANGLLSLAGRERMNPRVLAERVAAVIAVDGFAEVTVTGLGYLSFRLTDEFLVRSSEIAFSDPRLGIPQHSPDVVVVDSSGPNLAKELHVGHLRTTIIGDALARVLEFAGYQVVQQNHFGDWGTQFGMLIEHFIESGVDASGTKISDLDEFYREANVRFKGEPGFADRARARVVLLQSGDEPTRRTWRSFVEESMRHAHDIYDRLGIQFSSADARSESSYNDQLPDVVSTLLDMGIAEISQGAVCIFDPEFLGRDGQPSPLIIQKSDGGYLYGTTDLAAVRYRVDTLKAKRAIYVVDARQARHFDMVFAAAKRAGWLGETSFEHAEFGTILGESGRPFRTRDGEAIPLRALIDEAEHRALTAIAARGEVSYDLAESKAVAQAVGVGAIKFADLVNDRVKDYVFSWERMLQFDGRTGPYIQYSRTRARSIISRAGEGVGSTSFESDFPNLAEPERRLIIALLGLHQAIEGVVTHLQPHKLAGYLFDLAQTFTSFYQECPVLAPSVPERQRAFRLALVRHYDAVSSRGMCLLGLTPLERM